MTEQQPPEEKKQPQKISDEALEALQKKARLVAAKFKAVKLFKEKQSAQQAEEQHDPGEQTDDE